MQDFSYSKPTTLDAAADAFEGLDDGLFLAGGQTILPVMKFGLAQPSGVVDLSGVADLVNVEVSDTMVSIGAMATHAAVAASADVRRALPGLAHLVGMIGDPQVRNRGTIGGSLANNDPAASYPSAVLALNATVKTDKREIAADDFFTGMFDTALDEGELILAVSFPIPEEAGYKHFPNPASRFPIVGSFVAKGADGVRVAITGAGPCAFRQTEFEAAFAGGLNPDAIKDIKVSDDGLNSDIHASAEYRAHLINVMTRRAIGG